MLPGGTLTRFHQALTPHLTTREEEPGTLSLKRTSSAHTLAPIFSFAAFPQEEGRPLPISVLPSCCAECAPPIAILLSAPRRFLFGLTGVINLLEEVVQFPHCITLNIRKHMGIDIHRDIY